jgi:hypothetical protein
VLGQQVLLVLQLASPPVLWQVPAGQDLQVEAVVSRRVVGHFPQVAVVGVQPAVQGQVVPLQAERLAVQLYLRLALAVLGLKVASLQVTRVLQAQMLMWVAWLLQELQEQPV